MMEFIKHALGLCVESHPNLLTILLGTPTLGLVIYKVRKLWHITLQK